MLTFEIPFEYHYRDYKALVRRQEPLPFIISIIEPNPLIVPDSFIIKFKPQVIDPFKYRYPGLIATIADAIRNYCIDNKIPV